jgi:hypothetical protein
MPRLPPRTLNNVGYLYHSRADAESGADFGGSAFIVSIDAEVSGRAFMYAVTNWHVAVRDGASVLRMNTQSGEPDIFEFGPEDWQFDPRYDIAVAPIVLKSGWHQFSTAPAPEAFVMPADVERVRLGPGEDVFMIGRFIDHDGGPINRPAVRFGNISVMPSPIEQPNGQMADAYCVDLNSRTGYSGSPVFVYRTPGFDLEEGHEPDSPDGKLTGKELLLLAGTNYLCLLGIFFAHFPEEWEIREGKAAPTETAAGVPLISTGKYVRGLSGMGCVLPAWNIMEVLNLPKLRNIRDASNAALKREQARQGKAIPDPASALSEPDIAKRRDEALRRAMDTPPIPHKHT